MNHDHHGEQGHHGQHAPQRFDDMAAEWDTPARMARAQELAERMARHLPAPCDTILDLGCGTGLLGAALARQADHPVDVIGVDPSAQMRAHARSKGLTTVASLDVVCPGTVDCVVSSMALHHMADTAAVLTDCAIAVRPGGRVLIADLDEGQEFFHAHHHGEDEHDKVHHHGFNREHFAEVLRGVGLVDVSVVDAYRGHKPDPEDPEKTREFTVFLAKATRPEHADVAASCGCEKEK